MGVGEWGKKRKTKEVIIRLYLSYHVNDSHALPTSRASGLFCPFFLLPFFLLLLLPFCGREYVRLGLVVY